MNLGQVGTYPEAPSGLLASSRNPSLTEQLEHRKKDLEDRLKEVTDALACLKKNPELENMLNLIAKVRY